MAEESDWSEYRTHMLAEMKRLNRQSESHGEKLSALPHIASTVEDIDSRVRAMESGPIPEVRQQGPRLQDLERRMQAAELTLNGLAVRIAIFSSLGGFVAAAAMGIFMKFIK